MQRTEHFYEAARTWRVSIKAVGSGWNTTLDELLAEARLKNVISLQLVLSAAQPYLNSAVALMRKKGFFFGGIFPRWFGSDGIMLQYLPGTEPEYDGIRLYTAVAKELLEFICADRSAVMQTREG
jgi:hypothetical protein